MKNRFLPVILVLALCLGSFVLPAKADSFEPVSGAALAAAGAQNALTGANLLIYNHLKEEITKVANGTRDSSIIEINTAGMGIFYINGAMRGIDISAIVRALSADCPYELYWFDKVTGIASSYRGSRRDNAVTSLTFQFTVSQDYAVTNAAGTIYYPYQPDPAKTRAASAVIQNAQAVVEQNRGLSDFDKLAAYRDYICDQVSYNYAAAGSGNHSYGNPWQLIYVFDNNPDTNVVCEGYAKAFKYLCDQTDFSNRVECYIVSGRTPESHMWNLVRINGLSYLVDVTNSDTGNVGQYGGLFLAGSPNATRDGHIVNLPRVDLDDGRYIPAASLRYTYDGDTKALYDSSILTLAASDYEAADTPPADVPQPPAPAFTDVPDWCAKAVSWAVDKGVTNGVGDNKFAPGTDCTHAQILTMLWRAAGEAEIDRELSIQVAEPYRKAILWADDMGMIDLPTFDPSASCNRGDAVRYISQALLVSELDGANDFTDVPADAPCAYAVAWAVKNGITNGYANEDGASSFLPDKVCSRGEIVTLLHRAYVPSARLK